MSRKRTGRFASGIAIGAWIGWKDLDDRLAGGTELVRESKKTGCRSRCWPHPRDVFAAGLCADALVQDGRRNDQQQIGGKVLNTAAGTCYPKSAEGRIRGSSAGARARC